MKRTILSALALTLAVAAAPVSAMTVSQLASSLNISSEVASTLSFEDVAQIKFIMERDVSTTEQNNQIQRVLEKN